MKIKSFIFPVCLFILSTAIFTACKDKKSDSKENTTIEAVTFSYQCLMDCEHGKTYDKEGKCPVCKMDLKIVDQKSTATCAMHKVGKCDCKDKAGNGHKTMAYQCPMNCEHGKTYDKEGKCPVCKMDLKVVDHKSSATCTMHKDGNCKCEGDKCSCENYAEHNKKMSCIIGEDGKCNDENCEKHNKNKDCIMNKDGECICESGKCACVKCEAKKK